MTGIVPLKKEENLTSFFAVNLTKRIVGTKKCGHTGTLDPNATGVLPIAIGGATRFIELLPTHKKAYKATFKLGIRTDTLDIWGEVAEENENRATLKELQSASLKFVGKIQQLPPMYSAIKKDGVRLYELARKGVEVERTPRECEIYSLTVGEENGEFTLECECSAGTYIRTLINDIGESVGCLAAMTSLVRTSACGIELSECFTLDQLRTMSEKGELCKAIIPLERLLEAYPFLNVTEKQGVRFKNGGSLAAERVHGLQSKGEGLYRVYSQGEFLGLGEYKDTDLLVKRVYNNV